MALAGAGTAGPCLQMTRARTTSFWNQSRGYQGVGREGETMGTIPGALLHLSTRWDAQQQRINPPDCWGVRPEPGAGQRACKGSQSCASTACSGRARCGSGTQFSAEQSPHPEHHWGHLDQASIPVGAVHNTPWDRQHLPRAAPGDTAGAVPYSLLRAQ